MMPPHTPARPNLGELKKKSTSQLLRGARVARKKPVRFARFGAILVLLALASSAFYSSSAAPSFPVFSRGSLARSLLSNPFIKPVANSQTTNADDLFVAQGGPLAATFPAIERYFPLAAMPQELPGPETVTLYDSDCTTPKTDFALGDVVCAKVTGIPLGISRRLAWLDPDGFIEKTVPISSNGQTDLWTNPSTATGLIAGVFVVQNRGTWRVNIITSRGSVRASAFYTVKDAANPAADLSVFISALDDAPVTGGQVQYSVAVANRGPSDASNVLFKDHDFVNVTLASVTQTGGTENAFNCVTNDGTVDCSIANFPAGATAEFLLSFTAGPTGSTIDNRVTVSSDTTELNETDNSFIAQPLRIQSGGAPPSCILNCPSNITVTANTTQGNQSGAIVTYGGAEAFGSCGAVTSSPSSGSFFPVGATVVTSTSDQGGGSCSFTVTVIDTAPPTISCPSNRTVTAPDGSCEVSLDPGTPATTGNGVSVNGVRNDGQALDAPYPAGTTTITWTATDSDGRTAVCTQTITVNVNDTTPPTITAPPNVTTSTGTEAEANCGKIVGESELGTPDANDACSVNISRTGIPAGNFFPVGTTTITYTATDAAGNTATATQTVTVTDDAPPLVKLNGDNPQTPEFDPPTEVTTECGAAFTDLGATAVDSCAGAVPVTPSTVNTGTPGTYTIVYTATDPHGNVGTASRTVHVVDTTAPVIALNGANPLQVECHTTFTDPGATAHDGCSGNFAATASGAVNANVPGTYTITYTASDPSGNAAAPVTRTVNVVDTLGPVITLNGANPMTVECHTSFTDPGATANDACSGPVGVVASGSVNVNVTGSYTITYTSTDGAHSTTRTRIVNVVDTTAPTLTLKNVAISLWPPNHKYQTVNLTDLVLSASDGCDSTININNVVIQKVTSDETENGNGDGNTTNDIVIASNCKSVQLRSERDGGGNGRVYTITFMVRDAAGNTTTKTAKVTVPENQSGGTAVDSGPHYTVLSSCQ